MNNFLCRFVSMTNRLCSNIAASSRSSALCQQRRASSISPHVVASGSNVIHRSACLQTSGLASLCSRLGSSSTLGLSNITQSTIGNNLLMSKLSPVCSVQFRGKVRNHYQPSAWKRKHKHGLTKRMQTRGGIMILWRRKLKGRHVLTL